MPVLPGLPMPVVGSSAYNTAGQITSLVRSLLNDSQGNLFTDTVLLPYANSAYRKTQRALGNAGGGGFIQDDVLLVVPAIAQIDTSLQVAITDATAPPNQLPTDLLVPVKIWERPNGSTQDFVEMVDLSQHGGLPSRGQGLTLSVWEWRADGVYFLGACVAGGSRAGARARLAQGRHRLQHARHSARRRHDSRLRYAGKRPAVHAARANLLRRGAHASASQSHHHRRPRQLFLLRRAGKIRNRSLWRRHHHQ